ncbi:MAG TPA: DJ-1/PfpI family protein [Actinomycetota bacterium]|nr:DJ-1/PfpI family protein [Actinomycetota bacterium]
MEGQIAFVVYDGLTPLDLVGPLQVMSALERFSPEWKVSVVGSTLDTMSTDTPLRVAPSATFADVAAPAALIVPGGEEATLRAMYDDEIQDYVKNAAESAEIVASVCTGALILASAGLLEGRKATTHWAYAGLLEKFGATYVQERWVDEGKVITAAGVSAGIDLAIHLVARLAGSELAKFIQLGIEYDPQPPLGPMDRSPATPELSAAVLKNALEKAFADRPEILAKLTD